MPVTPTRKRNPSANVEMAVERIEIKPSANGGFAVECYKRPKERDDEALAYQPPKTYTFESLDGLSDFLREEFGGGESAADSVYDE